MGRRKLSDDELRKHSVSCRLTDSELSKIDISRPAGWRRGSWLRALALDRHLPKKIPAVNLHAWKILATAVANLNQISKHINQNLRTDLHKSELIELRESVQQLRTELLKGPDK
jgi:hypothetical protein